MQLYPANVLLSHYPVTTTKLLTPTFIPGHFLVKAKLKPATPPRYNIQRLMYPPNAAHQTRPPSPSAPSPSVKNQVPQRCKPSVAALRVTRVVGGNEHVTDIAKGRGAKERFLSLSRRSAVLRSTWPSILPVVCRLDLTVSRPVSLFAHTTKPPCQG